MARQAASMKKTCTRYSQAYKGEALALTDRVDISAAARELGLQSSQLYQWRAKAQQQQSASARERALADENVRLKRQLAEKPEELEIAKKPPYIQSVNEVVPRNSDQALSSDHSDRRT